MHFSIIQFLCYCTVYCNNKECFSTNFRLEWLCERVIFGAKNNNNEIQGDIAADCTIYKSVNYLLNSFDHPEIAPQKLRR